MPEQAHVNIGDLSDLCTPWCIHVVATLRIAEHIAAGTDDIRGLAAAASCDAENLHQVLSYLAGKGVFVEPQPGHFALNQVSEQLLDPAMQIGLDLDGIGGRLAYAWGTLLTYVRTGNPGYAAMFGRPFWEDLDAHPNLAASFDALIGPTGHGTPDPDFPLIGGWGAIGSVVDVGGGTGAMLAELLRAHPNIRGTLVDLPRTIARSGAIFEATGVAERATAVGQTFFDPLPVGADLYLLRGVLNDWPDQEAVAILRRCAEAAGVSGRVVVLKGVEPDHAPKTLSIEMVLLGGKYRSVAEFAELARQAGLKIAAAQRHPAGYYVVECHPA